MAINKRSERKKKRRKTNRGLKYKRKQCEFMYDVLGEKVRCNALATKFGYCINHL